MIPRVGDYELVRRIGAGGMAEVWMGRRTGVGGATKSVAVKFIIPSKTNSERHREMFLSEARLSMMLSHSNVIQVFDAGEDDGRLYMVMEWLDGMNLSQLLAHLRNQGDVPTLSVAGYVIGEILKGLAYAHNLYHEGEQITIVHRDISPQNVLVSVSGEVKLLDFGVARLSQVETSGIHIKGKLRYMAPEHLGGNSRDPTVDIYGAGAILHELVEGQKYRAGSDEMQLYNQILGGETPPLTRADTPGQLAELRAAMLDPDEHQRVQSADLALQMLEEWPGYRSAAGELSRLVRGFMGVNTPRSGINMPVPTRPTGPLDAYTDTVPPTAATATRDPSTGGTHPELSASHPGTDPSGAPAAMHPAYSEPIEVRRRSAAPLLLGLGVGLLVVGGAAGTALMMKNGDDDTVASATVSNVADEGAAESRDAEASAADDAAKPDEEAVEIGQDAAVEVASDGSPSAGAVEADAVEADAAEAEAGAVEAGAAEAGAAEAAPEDAVNAVEPEAKPEPRRNRGKKQGSKPRSKPAPKPSEPAANPKPQPRPKKPTVKVRVAFKLRTLKTAYVRVDGGSSIALEPMARRDLSVGSHSIQWRTDPSKPWVDGGKITIREGGKSTVRITPTGPRLE